MWFRWCGTSLTYVHIDVEAYAIASWYGPEVSSNDTLHSLRTELQKQMFDDIDIIILRNLIIHRIQSFRYSIDENRRGQQCNRY